MIANKTVFSSSEDVTEIVEIENMKEDEEMITTSTEDIAEAGVTAGDTSNYVKPQNRDKVRFVNVLGCFDNIFYL